MVQQVVIKDNWNRFILNSLICLVLIFISRYINQLFIDFKYIDIFYFEDYLFFGFLSKSNLFLLITALVVLLSFISYYYTHNQRLSKVESALYFVSIFLIFLNTVFIPKNWYFNQFHLVDRIILIVLFILALYRPAFVLLFWFFALLFIKQLQFPSIFYYTFTDKQIFYDIILFVFLWISVRPFGKLDSTFFYVSIWGMFSIWYFMAGYGKLEIAWWENNVTNLFLSSLPYGWLYSWPQTQKFLLSLLDQFNTILTILTLVAELSVIFFFIHRFFAIFLVGLLWSMHLFIFLASGVFFWKWMVFLIAMATVLFVFKDEIRSVFQLRYFLLSTLIVLFFGFVLGATKLSWLDSGVVNFHTITLDSKISKVENLRLDATFFAPYDVVFAQNRFYFLEEKPLLFNTYGSFFYSRDEVDISPLSGHKLKDAIAQNGRVYFDQESKNVFFDFLSVFVRNKLSSDRSFDYLPFYSPSHIYQGHNQKEIYLDEIGRYNIKVDYYEIDVRNPNQFDTLTHNVHQLIIK